MANAAPPPGQNASQQATTVVFNAGAKMPGPTEGARTLHSNVIFAIMTELGSVNGKPTGNTVILPAYIQSALTKSLTGDVETYKTNVKSEIAKLFDEKKGNPEFQKCMNAITNVFGKDVSGQSSC